MRFLENRRIAVIVLIVCVLAGIFGIGGAKLASWHNKVEDVFYNGTDTALSVTHSMESYLDMAGDAAVILAQEGMRHLGMDHELSAAVNQAGADLHEGGASRSRYEVFAQLKNDVETLYTAMCALGLGDAEMSAAMRAYDDFNGACNMIKFDAYAAMARAYNKAVSSQPAGLLTGLFGLEELSDFGG